MREVLESFQKTGTNYGKEIESLKTCFSREYLLIEVHIRGLWKSILFVQSLSICTISFTSLCDKPQS